LSNLRFAHEVEPGNTALAARIKAEQAKRDQGQATVPSSIGIEKLTNPFLRYREPAIIDRLISVGRLDVREPIATFAALREWKNSFR
jgi:hydroxyacylglutathione hydrolase